MPVDQRLLRVDSSVYGDERKLGAGETRARLALRYNEVGRGDEVGSRYLVEISKAAQSESNCVFSDGGESSK